MLESRLNELSQGVGRPVTLRSVKKMDPPKTPEQKKLWKTAKEFEGVMLGLVFKQMQASQGTDLLGGGAANKTWKEMLSEERAKSLSQHGGLGLADAIYQQLALRT
ncbi:MAG: rod-binding protein [Candidatus Sericytochromatia bacterium]|nr:rod-binding protein [Candidatus Sericytochromatia bacterium]